MKDRQKKSRLTFSKSVGSFDVMEWKDRFPVQKWNKTGKYQKYV